MKNLLSFKLIGLMILSFASATAALSQTAEVFYKNGTAKAAKGQHSAAILDFNRAIKAKPKYVEAYTARGESYFQLSKFAKALADYNKALEIDNSSVAALQKRAILYSTPNDETGNDIDLALKDLNRAIGIQPANAESYKLRAEYYAFSYGEDLPDRNKATADYSKAIEVDPNNPERYIERAEYLQDEAEQLADYTKAVELAPTKTEYLEKRIFALLDRFEFEKALADCNTILKLEPRSPFGYTLKAGVYERSGYYQKALDEYAKAMKVAPRSASPYRERAALYHRMGLTKNAEADEKKAILLEKYDKTPMPREIITMIERVDSPTVEKKYVPEFETAYFPAFDDLYNPIYQDGDTEEKVVGKQIIKLTKLINYNPSFDVAYAYRAENYFSMGENEKAIADYTAALKLKNNADYYNNRGILYGVNDDFEKARADFEQAVKLAGKHPLANFNLALISYKQNDFPRALSYLGQSIKDDGTFKNSYLFRAKISREQGNIKAAEADERTAKSLN